MKENFMQIVPLSHATMVVEFGREVIYNDPVGGKDLFSSQKKPSIILVSDIHSDHFDPQTLVSVAEKNTLIVVPQAVFDVWKDQSFMNIHVLHNGEKITHNEIEIEAFPMYNVPESSSTFHTKGRGNGYILSSGGKKIYIAGDTSVTPEMRALTAIDSAFIPMNLPYTMDIEEAADGVRAFKPKVVHPYHYRGQSGFVDVRKFKELVESKDPSITVELLNFYPESNK